MTLSLSLLFALCFCASHGGDLDSRPHIVVILADDLGWSDVGFHGSVQIPTPNLDALAYDGLLLADYHVEKICTPSRAALLTGRYPEHTGLQHSVIFGSMAYGLGLNETLLPQHLRARGYHTHMVGKWHLGFMSWDYTPTRRGFDSFYGFLGGKDDYWDHTRTDEGPPGTAPWGFDFYSDETVERAVMGEYSTELFTRRAEEVIAGHNPKKPLFLYLAQQAPHNGNAWRPLEAPHEYLRRFAHIKHPGRRTYAAMMSALDDSVGRVTAALARAGILNNTIIFVSTDNGGPAHGFSDNHASNYPLRGMKYTLWQGGVRGTALLWSPRLRSAPRTATQLMHITDVMPTLLGAAGVDTSELAGVDGYDMWTALSEDTPSPRSEVLLGIDPLDAVGSFALRSGPYKVIFQEAVRRGWYPPEGVDTAAPLSSPPLLGPSAAARALRSLGRPARTPRPLVVTCGPQPANASTNCREDTAPCLYDVIVDPCEYHNIADQYPDVLRRLLGRVEEYRAGMAPPRNQPYDPAGFPERHGGVWRPWRHRSQLADP